MAGSLSIGDVTFGVTGNVSGLQSSLSVIKNFESSLKNLQNVNKNLKTATVESFNAQILAMKRAVSEAGRLRAAMKRAGAPPGLLADNINNLKRLTKAMSGSALSANKMASAQKRFNAGMAKGKASLASFANTAGGAAGKTGKFGNRLRQLESASVLAVGPLSGVGARIRSMGAIATRSNLALAGLIVGITGVGIALFKLVSGSLAANKAFESMESRMLATFGSQIMVKDQMEFVTKVAREQRGDLQTLADGYSQLTAAMIPAGISLKDTQNLFRGVAAAGSVLRLTQEQMNGAIKAFTQIASKGKLQAEELTGQLAERIPGAIQIFANSMDIGTRRLLQMIKDGKILANDILPLVGEELLKAFGDQATDNVQSLTKSLNLLSTETFQFNRNFGELTNTSGGAVVIIDALSSSIRFLGENLDNAISVVVALTAALVAGLAGPAILGGVIALWKAFKVLAGFIRGATVATVALNIAMLTNPAGALAIIITRLALAGLAATAAFFGMREALDGVGASAINLVDDIDFLIAKAEKMGGAVKSSVENLKFLTIIEIEALEDRINNLKIVSDPAVAKVFAEHQSRMDRLLDGDPELIARGQRIEVIEMEKLLKTLQNRLVSLNNVKIAGADADIIGDEENKKLTSALASIDKLIRKSQVAKDQLAVLGGGGSESDVNFLGNLDQAAAAIAKIQKAGEGAGLIELRDKLIQAGIVAEGTVPSIDALRIALAEMLRDTDNNKEAIKTWIATLKSAPLAIADAEKSIARLKAEVAALAAGPEAFEQFEDADKINTQIDKFVAGLVKAKVAQDEINRLTIIYRNLLEQQVILLKDNADGMDALRDIAEDLTDTLGTGLRKAFQAGSEAADVFRETALKVIDQIMEAVIRLSIINPFLNSINGIGGGGGGDDSLSTLFSVGKSLIGAFSGGGSSAGSSLGPIGLKSGGIVGRNMAPTMNVPVSAFAGAPHFALGGVVGGGVPSILHKGEAVVPLSGGRKIPVEMSGGGGATSVEATFNIFGVTDANSFMKNQGDIATDAALNLQEAMNRNN